MGSKTEALLYLGQRIINKIKRNEMKSLAYNAHINCHYYRYRRDKTKPNFGEKLRVEYNYAASE